MSTSKFQQGQHKLQIQLTSEVNFFQWKKAIKDQLRTQGILSKSLTKYSDWLATPLPARDENNLAAWQEKQIENELVKLLIVFNISNTLKSTIDETKDAKTIWERINKLMIPNKTNHILMLKSQLTNLKMTASVHEYLLQVEEKVRQINDLQDEFIPDADVVGYIENGLPHQYKVNTKAMWLERGTHNSESYKEVIINYYTAQNSFKTETPINEANFTKSKKFQNKNKKHFKQKKSNQRRDEQTKLECVNCPHLHNHSTTDCRKTRKYCSYHKSGTHSTEECRKRPKQGEAHATTVETPEKMQESPQDWAFVCDTSPTNSNTYLTYDSACTVHLINNKKLIFDIQPFNGEIIVANNNKMNVTHCGKMILPGSSSILEVLYCPSAIRNLISGSLLAKEGFTTILNPDGTGSLHKNEETLKLVQKNGIWIFNPTIECYHTQFNKLMHRRLGHLGQDNVSHLLDPKNQLLKSYKFEGLNRKCPSCAEANARTNPFGLRNYTQSKAILEVIHTDLAGPLNTVALGGFRYIITFTDDWSRYITIQLLKNKNEATQALISYYNHVTNLHEKSIKRIHYDLGGEFVDHTWKDFCSSKGIQCTYAPRKSPQLNGISEVANRILYNKTRAMMLDTNLPKARIILLHIYLLPK